MIACRFIVLSSCETVKDTVDELCVPGDGKPRRRR